MNNNTQTTEQAQANELQEIGRNAYTSIAEMVSALDADKRAELEEAADEAESAADTAEEEADAAEEEARENTENDPEKYNAEEASHERGLAMEAREIANAARAAFDALPDEDDARETIQEDPLSVEVRSAWHTPGAEASPDEFKILLSTGGPATQIIGELNEHGEPITAQLQAQDWFTSWTTYREADEETLLKYCQQFFFGE